MKHAELECPLQAQDEDDAESDEILRMLNAKPNHIGHDLESTRLSGVEKVQPAEGILLDKHAPPKFKGLAREDNSFLSIQRAADQYHHEKVKNMGIWQGQIGTWFIFQREAH